MSVEVIQCRTKQHNSREDYPTLEVREKEQKMRRLARRNPREWNPFGYCRDPEYGRMELRYRVEEG